MLIYYFPIEWLKKGIEYPTRLTEDKTEDIICKLQYLYNLQPKEILPSIEGGLLISYFNEKNIKTLKIEVYNDFDVAAIVIDEKECKPTISEDIENLNFDTILNEFLS